MTMSFPVNIGVRGKRLNRSMKAFLETLDVTGAVGWRGVTPCRLMPAALGRSEPPRTVNNRRVRRRVILLSQFFLPSEPTRLREIQRALALNCSNEEIAEVRLLVEREYSCAELGVECSKIVQEVIGRRLKFFDAFGRSWFGYEKERPVCVLANADISFDNTLSAVHTLNLTNHVLCLRRTEMEAACASPSPVYSQDAWIWDGVKMDDVRCDIEVGRSGCDNRLVYELLRGGKVPTVFDDVKAWHHHLSPKRPGRAVGRIDGPYMGLVPQRQSGMHPTGDALALREALSGGTLIAANLCSGGGRVAHWGSDLTVRPSEEAREEGIRAYIASDNYGAELYARLYARGLRTCTHVLRPAPWEEDCDEWVTSLIERLDSDVVHLHSDAAAHLEHPGMVDLEFGRSSGVSATRIVLQKSLVAEGPFIARYGKLCEMLGAQLSGLAPGLVLRVNLGAFSVPLLDFLAKNGHSAVCRSEIRIGVKREVALSPRLVG